MAIRYEGGPVGPDPMSGPTLCVCYGVGELCGLLPTARCRPGSPDCRTGVVDFCDARTHCRRKCRCHRHTPRHLRCVGRLGPEAQDLWGAGPGRVASSTSRAGSEDTRGDPTDGPYWARTSDLRLV